MVRDSTCAYSPDSVAWPSGAYVRLDDAICHESDKTYSNYVDLSPSADITIITPDSGRNRLIKPMGAVLEVFAWHSFRKISSSSACLPPH